MNIRGKTALVTGASRGIGREIALEFARQGMARLILVARDHRKLEEVAALVTSLGVDAIVLPLDLTRAVEVNIAIARTWRQYGPIHLLVNCAGVAHQSPFLKSRLTQVQEEISLNLLGIYTITHAIARRMVSKREGRIVNVSSLMGKIAAPTMATYSATKFGIIGFTQALRSELAEYNIQVTALLPTLTDTDMARNLKLFRWVIPTSPQKVAQVLVAGLEKEATEILVGWQSHLAMWCNRFAPGLLEWLIRLASPASPEQNPYLSKYRVAGGIRS